MESLFWAILRAVTEKWINRVGMGRGELPSFFIDENGEIIGPIADLDLYLIC